MTTTLWQINVRLLVLSLFFAVFGNCCCGYDDDKSPVLQHEQKVTTIRAANDNNDEAYQYSDATDVSRSETTTRMGLTPPMGWNSWNRFGCNISEALIEEMTDALISQGLDQYGYEYINLDDCWQLSRNQSGYIVEDWNAFPSGMAHLSDYVHAKGLKFGLYSDAGWMTCQSRPGSLKHESKDAAMYAQWKVDYLKYDNCFSHTENMTVQERYQRMHQALQEQNHDIFFSMCEWGVEDPATWARSVGGNSWRTTDDISAHWKSIVSVADLNDKWHDYAGPGGWNDPDMLEVGNGGITLVEQRSHFTLWCLMKAPLLLGNDLRNMAQDTIDIITNHELIAWNQDPLGIQGYKRSSTPDRLEVWAGSLSLNRPRRIVDRAHNKQNNNKEKGHVRLNTKTNHHHGKSSTIFQKTSTTTIKNGSCRMAVVLWNRSEQDANITATWEDLGLDPATVDSVTLRDVWAHEDLPGTYSDPITLSVESHGVVAVELVCTTQREQQQ